MRVTDLVTVSLIMQIVISELQKETLVFQLNIKQIFELCCLIFSNYTHIAGPGQVSRDSMGQEGCGQHFSLGDSHFSLQLHGRNDACQLCFCSLLPGSFFRSFRLSSFPLRRAAWQLFDLQSQI